MIQLDSQQEEWRVISECPHHSISNMGRIMRIAPGPNTSVGRILIPRANRHGYLVIGLKYQNKTIWRTVQRLVLEAFLGKRPSLKHTGHHKNTNKEDNRLDNLEWITYSENEKHAYQLGLKSNGLGEKTPNAKLKDGEVYLVKRLLASGKVKQRFIAKIFKVHFATINAIKTGHIWGWLNYP